MTNSPEKTNLEEQEKSLEVTERIGKLSMREWLENDLCVTEKEKLPEIKDTNDLKRVLGVQRVVDLTYSSYENWIKEWVYIQDEDKEDVIKYLKNSWLDKVESRELKETNPRRWSMNFDRILSMIAHSSEVPDNWIDALKHKAFFTSAQQRDISRDIAKLVENWEYESKRLQHTDRERASMLLQNAKRIRKACDLP